MAYTVQAEHFKTLDEMVYVIGARPMNRAFTQAQKADSNDTGNTAERFTGTIDYMDNLKVMDKGYKEPLNQLKEGIEKSQRQANIERKRPVNSIVGFRAHVPSYIAGHPMSMVNRVSVPEKKKMVHLTYGFTAHGSINKDKLVQAGILFLSLVNELELEGYRVKIDVLFCSLQSKHVVGYTVNIKEYSQALNLLSVSYPLVHPSMLRRTSFKWLETFPLKENKTTDNYPYGYGSPLTFTMNKNSRKELEFLKENKIVHQDSYFANFYDCYNNASTVDELKKVIGLNI